jgi:hypothetical protein
VDRDGIVYEKDLGTNTVAIAKAMTEPTPDATWRRIDELAWIIHEFVEQRPRSW